MTNNKFMSFSWNKYPNFNRVEKKKQHMKREKEKEDRRDVLFFIFIIMFIFI